MKGRQLTDVSRRRFDVSQSPVQLQGSPDFGRLRDSSSPLPSPLLLPSFVLQARSPSFQLLRSHPFSSVNEPVERKGERRWVEQRESKNFALCPATFSLSLLLASAQVFSSSFSVFFPPSLFFFFLPLPLPPTTQISRHNRRSEPKLSILEINGIIIITSLLFLLSETMRNIERGGERERGNRTFIIFGKLVIGLASSTRGEE